MSHYKRRNSYGGTTKKEALTIHAKKRLKQRFGLEVNHRIMITLREIIGTSSSHFICRDRRNGSHWLLLFKGLPIIVVYNEQRKLVVTCLEVESYIANGGSLCCDWKRGRKKRKRKVKKQEEYALIERKCNAPV